MSKFWFYFFLLIISSYHLSAGQEETESTILQGHPDDMYWDTTFHFSRQPQAYVDAIVKNDVLYILAYQYYDNGNLVNAILRWSEAEGWKVVCTGVPDGVAAIEVYGESIYIGGTFEEVYGIPAANVAVWDPHNGWSALGAGLTSPTPEYNQVLDLAITENGILYASGLFTKSADKTVEGIAWWNGVSWQALGNSYLEGMCWNIVADGNMLYAGRIGERIATHPNGYDSYTVAQWDGTQWREVGNNLTGNPYRLLVRNNVVYVAGALSVGDSETACYVVRWDGTTWQKLGEEFGSNVDNITEIALTNSGELFAAGGNWEGNAAQLNKIALWNGGQWQGLGSGVGKGGINEMVAIDDDIIITGSPLLQVGGKTTSRMARWHKVGTDVFDVSTKQPKRTELFCTPNPTVAGSVIHFALEHSSHVQLAVYTPAGQWVATLCDAYFPAGTHTYEYDAKALNGGVYYCRLLANSTQGICPLIVVR